MWSKCNHLVTTMQVWNDPLKFGCWLRIGPNLPTTGPISTRFHVFSGTTITEPAHFIAIFVFCAPFATWKRGVFNTSVLYLLLGIQL